MEIGDIMMMAKRDNSEKGGVNVTPISGNLVFIGGLLVVLIVIYFVFAGGIPSLPAGPGGPTGESSIKSEAEVGEAMVDVGSDVQDLTDILKGLDDKIA